MKEHKTIEVNTIYILVMKIQIIIIALALLGLLTGLSSCYYDNREDLYPHLDQPCNFDIVSFSTDIVPVLEAQCNICHSATANQGNVNLEGYENVKAYANNGSLYGSVAHDPGYSPMPSAAQKILQCDIDKIRAWVEAGAPDN